MPREGLGAECPAVLRGGKLLPEGPDERKPAARDAEIEALRRSLAERESALAHAVRELAHVQRDAAEERARAERQSEGLLARAARLEDEMGRLRAQNDELRRGADEEGRRRLARLEEALRAAELRALEASATSEDRARMAELSTAEWHRLLDETAELRTRLLLLTRPPPLQPILTPGTLTRLAEAARKLRCPRCANPMTEYKHHLVHADKCEECFGIFFDNGELELVIAKTLEDRDAQWTAWGDLFRREP